MINYLEHHIVDHCNLNCAGCSHFSPLAQQWFEDIEDFKRDFTQLAEITNKQVGTIRLMGGEPLLHPQVLDFLIITRQLFPYSQIQIVSNGILIPSMKQELLKVCNENNILICVSNYGLNMDLRQVLNGFNKTRIDWKNQMYNISLDTTGTQDPARAFNGCDLHVNHWYYFQNGCFYPCCICANIDYFNQYFNLNLECKNEYISIYNHTEDEIKQFLNQPITLCKYCNTALRNRSYSNFHVSKKDIKEWTYQ